MTPTAPADESVTESVLRRSSPVLLTTFVNRMGNIGLDLLPMLLVARHVSVADSAWVMALTKASQLSGTFFGGWFADRTGLRAAILMSLLTAGLGLALMPWTGGASTLVACAVVAAFGTAMYNGPTRLLLMQCVRKHEQQEAIGWSRMAANLGQVVSYGFGSVVAGLGVAFMMMFDASTSLLAAGLSIPLLKRADRRAKLEASARAAEAERARAEAASAEPARVEWKPFVLCTLMLMSFYFLYETFISGASARFRIVFGDAGLTTYMRMMGINVVLCSLFAVQAARKLRDPRFLFPISVSLTAAGVIVAVAAPTTQILIFLSIFAITGGEILIGAIAHYTLIRVMPEGARQGTVYSASLVVQATGRILAGAMVFPLYIHGAHPALFAAIAGGVAVVTAIAAGHATRLRAPAAASAAG